MEFRHRQRGCSGRDCGFVLTPVEGDRIAREKKVGFGIESIAVDPAKLDR
jgi:hypothetical protein